MTLCSLDVIVQPDGRRSLLEINGINSGMRGFRVVYGDDRVEQRVYAMLRERYGEIAVDNGTYHRAQFRQRHPVWYALSWMRDHLQERFPFLRSEKLPPELQSTRAIKEWLGEQAHLHFIEIPFPIYVGQDAAVFNLCNLPVPHPTINPAVAQAITNNKFFQYRVLQDSAVREAIPPTALVGMGATDEKTLAAMLDQHTQFVQKPIRGSLGKGVRVLSKNEAERYHHSRGPIEHMDFLGMLQSSSVTYVEDLVAQSNFTFELGLGIIQPFIESRRTPNDQYESIRAIVCNGQFVDAYARRSPTPRANLAQGATAHAFTVDDQFAAFCEQVVAAFLERCAQYAPETFQHHLWSSYFEERGRTTDVERVSDRLLPAASIIMKVVDSGAGVSIHTFEMKK